MAGNREVLSLRGSPCPPIDSCEIPLAHRPLSRRSGWLDLRAYPTRFQSPHRSQRKDLTPSSLTPFRPTNPQPIDRPKYRPEPPVSNGWPSRPLVLTPQRKTHGICFLFARLRLQPRVCEIFRRCDGKSQNKSFVVFYFCGNTRPDSSVHDKNRNKPSSPTGSQFPAQPPLGNYQIRMLHSRPTGWPGFCHLARDFPRRSERSLFTTPTPPSFC